MIHLAADFVFRCKASECGSLLLGSNSAIAQNLRIQYNNSNGSLKGFQMTIYRKSRLELAFKGLTDIVQIVTIAQEQPFAQV